MKKQTKFVDRVAAAFGFSRMIDAVNHRSEERGWVYAQAQDSKVDLSSYDRTRLMALSRKCFYNNAIVRCAAILPLAWPSTVSWTATNCCALR